ncbi:MAG TPA: ABC transporter permease [Fimbriiglobus sp.]
MGEGQYSFRLNVKASAGDSLKNLIPFIGEKATDGLRVSVANWLRPAGKKRTFNQKNGPGMEVAELQEVSLQDQKAVTDDELVAFIRHQYEIHAGFSDVTVRRVTSGVKEPNYVFDVDVKSGSGVKGWPHGAKIFFGAVNMFNETPLGLVLWIIEDRIVNGFGAGLTLLIGIIVTGFFIPNMLRKGALDLLINKPITRTALLVYKYIGGLSFILFLTAFTVGGMWLVLAIRTGFWNPTFLYLIPILTFTFAILYAFSTLIAVLTRSAVAAILLTCGFAFFLYVIGNVKTWLDGVHNDPGKKDDVPAWVYTTVDIIHGGLPRYKDLDRLTTKMLSESTLTPLESFALAGSKADYPDWVPTFGVSLAFIAVCLGLASWRFVTRDG